MKTWLITGVAGFIGSHLLEYLLSQNQQVIGVDNFLTGRHENLDEVQARVRDNWRYFKFVQADITTPGIFDDLLSEVDVVLHQAALGSVPRSIENPLATHKNNVEGFMNLLDSLKTRPHIRLVYASSSSVYGDHPQLPKMEDFIGNPQSPYAATKHMNEIYAKAFANAYGIKCVGLRYFNVFGPRQDPESVYAAVIPKWVKAFLKNAPVEVNGDGETSRDFSFIDNVVQANMLAANTQNVAALNQVYNVAFGSRTTLNELYSYLKTSLIPYHAEIHDHQPTYKDFRKGDIRHSLANIEKAKVLLQYHPEVSVQTGILKSIDWYVQKYNEV
jgi:UDP-N-acetylglucosamine 4-epimerase